MMRMLRFQAAVLVLAAGMGGGCGSTELSRASAPEMFELPPPPTPTHNPSSTDPVGLPAPPETVGGKPYPINLPTALKLGNVRGLDIELASRRLQAAGAQWQGARVLW